MKRGFSIRAKFLFTTTALLLACVAVYLLMATRVFRQDKTELVYDFNRSLVTSLAGDLETEFAATADKMRLVAHFFNSRDEKSLEVIRGLLSESEDLVMVAGSSQWPQIDRVFYQKDSFLETYDLKREDLSERLLSQSPFAKDKLLQQGEVIWRVAGEQGPPLLGYVKSVVLEDERGRPVQHYAVIALINTESLIKSLGRSRLNPAILLDRDGEILVKPLEARFGDADRLLFQELTREAQATPVRTSVVNKDLGSESYLGAYAKAVNDQVLVVSRARGSDAFAVVEKFTVRSLLVAMLVANLAFIVAILFSRTVTKPLETLMGGMEKVAQGELDTQIQVRSRDELAVLAESFNRMIVDLKQSRLALEEVNRDLEAKVKERTQQLEKQNQAVKSAQEALLRTTRLAAVGEIAGRAAHEVLNPLTTILGRLERLQQRVGEERARDLAWLKETLEAWQNDFATGGFTRLCEVWKEPSKIQSQATLWDEDLVNLKNLHANMLSEVKGLQEDSDFLLKEALRIERIVQAMRNLSVVQAQKRRLDLSAIIEESLNVMGDLAQAHGVRLLFKKLPEPAWAEVDSDEMLQALTNLIRNSIQAVVERRRQEPTHNFAGEVRLALSGANDLWRLEIEDDGCGILPADQSRLFESQFSTKSPHEGTGLGLNISRRFVRGVGGDISLVRSSPGQGTVFAVTIPKSQQQEVAA